MIALITGLSLCAATPVSVEGRAPLGTDRKRAEELARRDARREALERGAGVALQSMSVVRNFALVADAVSTHSRGVLLDEAWGPFVARGNELTVSLRARVEPAVLGAEACRVLNTEHEPVVIAVLSMKGSTRDGPAEAELMDQLMGACVRVVHMDVDALDPAKPQAILLRARELGARYVLFADLHTEGGGARVVDVGDNRVVASAPGSAPRALADALFQQLAARWTDHAVHGVPVLIALSTQAPFSDAKALAASIASLLSVEAPTDVTLRDGFARFTLRIPGGGRAAAEKLDGAALRAATGATLVIRVTESNATTLTLEPASNDVR